MATTFAGTFKMAIDGLYTSEIDLGTAKETIGVSVSDVFASGVGDGQADLWGHDQRSISGSDTIDLTSDLSDIFGTTLALATLKGIVVHHTGTAGNLLVTGNAIANAGWAGASGSHLIMPGGWWVVMAPNTGYTITNTTQDQLTFVPSAGTIVYDLYLLGTSS